jgi:ribonuclease J
MTPSRKPGNPSAQPKSGQPDKDQKSKPSQPSRGGGASRGRRPAAGRRPPRSMGPARRGNDESAQPTKPVAEITNDHLRIIPLGGVEEIGKNMTAFEYKDDIIVIDAGLAFPGDEAPGVDYIIPDTTYLEERKHKVRALVVTHGHLDHIGGIPYVMEKMGNPPIYTQSLTAIMIKKRQEEFPHLPKLNINVIDRSERVKIGNLFVRFFASTHTIPDSMGVIIETPYGNIVFTGDIKVDHIDGVPQEAEIKTFEKLGKENNLLLIADSTNVEKPGFSEPEWRVQENLKKIIAETPGRIIFGTFASLFERLIYVIKAAEELGMKVAIEGRSMKTNLEIAQELGILKVKKDTIIPSDEIDSYADDKILVVATGAQGDEFAALMRISQKEHRNIKIKKGDTILLSSSVIPGNEKSVQKLKDNLARQGAKIIHYGVANVHSTGHSYQGEIEWLHKMIKPKYFIPVHGHHSMLRVHADVAMRLGMPEQNIVVPDNGMIIEITDQGQKIAPLKETTSSRVVMVDGLGTNNVKEVVIRDRQMLAQDGMFVIIAIVDMKTGKVRKSPDIISRGFVYLKESQDLLRHVRMLAKKKIEDATAEMHPINFDYVKNSVREELGKYLFQKTHKRPIILPVLIEV